MTSKISPKILDNQNRSSSTNRSISRDQSIEPRQQTLPLSSAIEKKSVANTGSSVSSTFMQKIENIQNETNRRLNQIKDSFWGLDDLARMSFFCQTKSQQNTFLFRSTKGNDLSIESFDTTVNEINSLLDKILMK